MAALYTLWNDALLVRVTDYGQPAKPKLLSIANSPHSSCQHA
jgi:hypothetical protein